MINTTELALFILRLFVGASLIYHGWPKLKNWKGTFHWLYKELPLPLISTIAIIAVEVFGGAFLILGIGVRYVSIIAAFAMLVAAYYHFSKKEGYFMKAEVPIAFFIMLAVLAIAGGGLWQIAP